MDRSTDPRGFEGYGFQAQMQRKLQRPGTGSYMPRVIISTSIAEAVYGLGMFPMVTRGATHSRAGRR